MTRLRPCLALLVLLGIAACAGPQRTADQGARRVRLSMAEQLARRGDWPRAFSAADALTREDPQDVPARLLRGTALRHQGLLTESESDLRRVVATAPRNAAAHAELALLLEQAARPDDALHEHEKAHQLAPHEPRYLNDLGFARMVRGDARSALPLFEEALRAEPGNARYRNNLGFACAATGDFARSAHEFASAGTPSQARNNLGLAYERAGDLRHAYELYLESWRLDPNPIVRDNLEHAAGGLSRKLPPDVASSARPAQKEGT